MKVDPQSTGGAVTLLDGGLATELEARGHDLSDALWSARLLVEQPDEIRSVHESYAAAGADCLITAGYQVSYDGFARQGLSRADADRALSRSIELARSAARGDVRVVASVGPYGAARADGSEYTGAYDLDEPGLLDWHGERFAHLAASDADFLACETIPSAAEARALLQLLEHSDCAHAWFSFSCRDGAHIADGTSLAAIAAELDEHPRVVAIGINCTPPRHVESLLRKISTLHAPRIVYPNSGESWNASTRAWHGECDPGDFATRAARWHDLGATWIGGCCRTGPAHIRAMRERWP